MAMVMGSALWRKVARLSDFSLNGADGFSLAIGDLRTWRRSPDHTLHAPIAALR